jgi:coiled-coil domain-containing protein 12
MTDRKDRLAALSAKAGRSKQHESSNESNEASKLSFRNYTPTDASLVQSSQDAELPSPAKKKLKIEEALKQAQDEVKKEFSTTPDAVGVAKKINWDLKRDIELQIDKLERRTQRAMVMLLKEKLTKEADENKEIH